MRSVIYVCDAIMGAGKTSAAINFMNARPTQKFIYVTPFNSECERIRDACPSLHFRIPSNAKAESNHQKREDLKVLMRSGKNIAMSHTLLSLCDDESIEIIREQHYTMFVDEVLSIMDAIRAKADDVVMAMSSKWLKCDTDDVNKPRRIEVNEESKQYTGVWMRDIKLYANSHKLVALQDDRGEDRLYCMMINSDILTAADDTYILTYIFKASPLYYLLQMDQIDYKKIGISISPDGMHQLSVSGNYIPAYLADLPQKIHIEQNEKLNGIGERTNQNKQQWFVLSAGWQQRAASRLTSGHAETLRKNLNNFFRNLHGDIPANERLWTCTERLSSKVAAKGYSKSRFLSFNARSVNNYRNCRALAYCMNVFMPLWEKKYLEQTGLEVDEDAYALSVMLQWIWRSAIRDGGEIWIYVPSRRMRELLENWIKEVSEAAKAGSSQAA